MKATCTKCNFSDEIPDSFLGKTVRCPQCATEIKLIDKANLTFELVEEPSETLPQKTQPACDINVNVQAQPREIVEHDISTLRTSDGYIKLTTRHLRGEFKAKIKENGCRKTIKTSVDTLLSGVVGFHVTTESNTAVKVFLGFLAVGGAFGGVCGFLGGAPVVGFLVLAVGVVNMIMAMNVSPSYDFSFIVTGKEYAIDIPESKVKEGQKFIKLLKEAKEQFERGV